MEIVIIYAQIAFRDIFLLQGLHVNHAIQENMHHRLVLQVVLFAWLVHTQATGLVSVQIAQWGTTVRILI